MASLARRPLSTSLRAQLRLRPLTSPSLTLLRPHQYEPHTFTTRSISTSSPARRSPPQGPPGGGQGGGGIGNIFGGGKREPGAALTENGVDLTALAREGKLDPVIGRDEEIKRTIQILSRRTKNNPLLVGAAGVGEYPRRTKPDLCR